MLQANHSISRREAEEKLLKAILTLMSLKFAAFAAAALSFIVVVLFVFYLIFSAIYQVCGQLAQLWAASNAIEKLIFVALAWAFLAWAWKQAKRFNHAAA